MHSNVKTHGVCNIFIFLAWWGGVVGAAKSLLWLILLSMGVMMVAMLIASLAVIQMGRYNARMDEGFRRLNDATSSTDR
jgi:membrane protein implicated in regulation of membrane protease activity